MHHDFELYQKVHKCENCILSFLEISVERDQALSFVDWQKYAANCRYQRQKIVGSCTWNLFVEIWDSPRMSLVAHRFGRVEFRIFVVVFSSGRRTLKNQNKYSIRKKSLHMASTRRWSTLQSSSIKEIRIFRLFHLNSSLCFLIRGWLNLYWPWTQYIY